MKKNAANAGFTLVEVIISLAVLSIASVFVLQMFVTASQLNRNAHNIDQANSQVSALMESFLLCRDPADFAQDSRFYQPQVETADGVTTITCYFNEDWQSTTLEGQPLFAMRAVISPQEEGPVTAAAFGEDDAGKAYVGRLYALEAEVLYKMSDGREIQLAAASIQRYFQLKEALP